MASRTSKSHNLHRHLLFDSSMNHALLAGVDDADDEDTSLAGVPVPNATVIKMLTMTPM